MRAWWAWVIVPVLFFALTGCGGGSEDVTPAPTMLNTSDAQVVELSFDPLSGSSCSEGAVLYQEVFRVQPDIEFKTGVVRYAAVRACVSRMIERSFYDDAFALVSYAGLTNELYADKLAAAVGRVLKQQGLLVSGGYIRGLGKQVVVVLSNAPIELPSVG